MRRREAETTVHLKRGNHTFRLEHVHGKFKATLNLEMGEESGAAPRDLKTWEVLPEEHVLPRSAAWARPVTGTD